MKKALSMILAIMMVLSTLSCLSVVSFAADAPTYEAEVEDNDTNSTAQEIEAEKIYRGNSNDAGDVDWYKFKNTHDYFELTFKFDVNSDMTGVKDGWTIYLYRPEDLNSAFISETVTTASWTSAKYPYTGEIYVKVQPDAFDNGYYAPKANSYYNIGVTTAENALWENEDNNEKIDATILNIGDTYIGASQTRDDIDWYKFNNGNDYFELSFNFDVNSNLDGVVDGWDVFLYRPEDLNSAFASETVTTSSWTSAKYPYTGEIYVKVQPRAFDNGYYAPKANSYYNIGVTTTQNVLWENEDNDEKIDATTLNIGDTYIGASQTRDDIDWYKFNNENDYFELSFNFDANSNLDGVVDGWTIYLYRPEDLNSAFISETVTTASWTSAKYPYTGEIYVKVQPAAFDNGYYAPKANSYYNIGVTTTQNVLWENEINDSTKEANVIKNGTKYIGASQTYGDVDWYKLENKNGFVDIVLDIDYDKCSAEQVGDGWSVFVYSDNDFTTPVFKKTYIKAKTNLTKIAIGNYAYIKVQPDALNNNYYAPEANCYYDLTVTHTPATPKVATTNEIGGVNVTWNKVDGATKYVVYRRQGGYNTWVNVGTTTGTALLDKNVKSGIYYVYSVRAYNALGKYSDFVQANTQTRKYMATPKLTTIYNHQNGLAIKWNAVAGVTNGYRVYRRGAGSTYWTYLGTTKNLYFIDSQVKAKSGEYFRYTVIADGGYHSKFDTTGLYLKRLANPTLTSAVSSTAGITVKWGAVKGTTGYYVYRKTANSTWTRVGTVGGTNNTTFLDKTARKGTTYTYTVKAVYGATTSAYNAGISCYDKY